MKNLPMIRRTVAAALTVALLLAALVASNRVRDTYTVTAEFAETPGLYAGNEVVVLGVPVGSIVDIKPHGNRVSVVMEIDGDVHVPADAFAILEPQSVVTDRVVELAPAYTKGPELGDDAEIPVERTRTPVEFQDVVAAVDDLSAQLGKVERHSGAIDDFMNVAARNARGNGARLRDTLSGVRAALSGFTANRGDMATLIRGLARLTHVMANSDSTVRRFSDTITQATEIFSGEGENINAGLGELMAALRDLAGFVNDNRVQLRRGVTGLAGAAETFGARASDVAEIVDLLPLLMQNVHRAIDPEIGIKVRAQLINSVLNGGMIGGFCEAITELPLCQGIPLRAVGPDLGTTELLTGSMP